MQYEIQFLKMGQCEVPGPEVYWMSNWNTWETLNFWMVLIRGGDKISSSIRDRRAIWLP